GMLVSANDLMNDAVREVLAEIDLRSTRRKANLSPNLFTGVFEYVCPSDLKAQKIIAVNPQTDERATDWALVPANEFTRKQRPRSLAFLDADFVRKLLISAVIDDTTLIVAPLDSTTSGGGTWSAF